MKIFDNPTDLRPLAEQLGIIADRYKDQLGFWSPTKMSDAIGRRKMIAAVIKLHGKAVPVGFLVHSGVYPSSKIQAIAVHPDYHRQGIAQILLDTAISQLEADGFISVCAKPAEDLIHAQAFYQKNGFEFVKTEVGGKARQRQIVVRERLLKVPNLLDYVGPESPVQPLQALDNVQNRLWVIDINVLFDLLKSGRDRYPKAYGVFGAALAGRISVAVTCEFRNELQRTSGKFANDPILPLASALPTIVVPDSSAIDKLAAEVHDLVFDQQNSRQANTPQAISDCRHIAECVLGKATAFVTSDGPLLKSRTAIRKSFGLEVAALDDFHDALSFYDIRHDNSDIATTEFRITNGSHQDAIKLLEKTKSQPFVKTTNAQTNDTHRLLAYSEDNTAIGFLNLSKPATFGLPHTLILIVDHQDSLADQVADALMGKALNMLTSGGPHHVTMPHIPGQSSVRRIALQLGFKEAVNGLGLSKLVLGRALTPSSMRPILNKVRLTLGDAPASLMLPDNVADLDHLFESDISEFERLERSLSPGLLVANQREIIIQPIREKFAAELLGTSNQMNFLPQFNGASRTEKVYVCSSKKRKFFRTNQIILFYESVRTGGRGAVVAVANIANVMLQDKDKINKGQLNRTVLDTVDRLSSTKQVTLVTFNTLIKFPNPVGLEELKRLGAHTGQNFISTTKIATKVGQDILDKGWIDA